MLVRLSNIDQLDSGLGPLGTSWAASWNKSRFSFDVFVDDEEEAAVVVVWGLLWWRIWCVDDSEGTSSEVINGKIISRKNRNIVIGKCGAWEFLVLAMKMWPRN